MAGTVGKVQSPKPEAFAVKLENDDLGKISLAYSTYFAIAFFLRVTRHSAEASGVQH